MIIRYKFVSIAGIGRTIWTPVVVAYEVLPSEPRVTSVHSDWMQSLPVFEVEGYSVCKCSGCRQIRHPAEYPDEFMRDHYPHRAEVLERIALTDTELFVAGDNDWFRDLIKVHRLYGWDMGIHVLC